MCRRHSDGRKRTGGPRHRDAQIVEGFAGAGGWSLGLRLAGYAGRAIGIELDPDACATASAAGHDRIQADVATIDLTGFGKVDGLIMSPPCESWSPAGKRRGERDRDAVLSRMAAFARGRVPDVYDWADNRSALTAEPLRYARALGPRWIALEQVPQVLPIWQHAAALLRELAYNVWCGILSAERYGVPQTRKRAVLIARRDGIPALPPAPTFEECRAGHRSRTDADLFGTTLQKPSTMARALGWDRSRNRAGIADWVYERPATTVQGTGRIGRPGHKDRAGGESQFGKDSVNVTVSEAGILQGFPPDYPWHGSKTAQHRQIGGAVPPPLAAAILAQLVPPTRSAGDLA
ncbi:DNA cytosine methyltransferase [Amycolatopsis sp. NPDC004079]|uniref:DNA cytosine methyltransferase n=1 Tax=Amycolatopsis sp. NPDC004079 TaxID=3154549 RepID=UPI0033B72E09